MSQICTLKSVIIKRKARYKIKQHKCSFYIMYHGKKGLKIFL